MIDERRPLLEAIELHELFMNLDFTPQTMFEWLLVEPEVRPEQFKASLDVHIDNKRQRIM
ncbi:MAG: hypothetical protein AABX51_05670 [Nanoarchaeota archaeon]